MVVCLMSKYATTRSGFDQAFTGQKSYALTKMVTTAARADQEAYFQNDRFPPLGSLKSGEMQVTAPLVAPDAPAMERKEQGELF